MTVVRNNFDGGADGTDITTASSASGGDAFNSIPKSGSGIVKYASSEPLSRPTAEFVARFASTTPAGLAVCAWNTALGSQSQIWLRMYMNYVSVPSTASAPYPSFFSVGTSGDVAMLYLGVTTGTAGNNKVFAMDGPGATTVSTTGSITAGRWFRVEARVQFSATTGNGEVYLFDDADSDTATEMISFTNWNLTSSTAARYYIGYIGTLTNQRDLYMSGVEVNNTGFPGPAPFRPGKGVPGILTNPVAIHTDAS